MRFSGVALTALLTSQFASAAPTSDDEVAVADLAKQAYDKTREEVTSTPKRSLGGNTCSLRNLRVRRDVFPACGHRGLDVEHSEVDERRHAREALERRAPVAGRGNFAAPRRCVVDDLQGVADARVEGERVDVAE